MNTYVEPARINGIPTNWSIDRQDVKTIPLIRIGPLVRPVLDAVFDDDDTIIYFSVMTDGAKNNKQELHTFTANLGIMGMKNRKPDQQILGGSVEGKYIANCTGIHAPDDTEYYRSTSTTHKTFSLVKTFGKKLDTAYGQNHLAHPQFGCIELQYYAETWSSPLGHWLIPMMMPLAERKEALFLEVMHRCTTLVLDDSWKDWLYSYVTHTQLHPQFSNSYIACLIPLQSYGRFQGFRFNLDESLLRKVISQAIVTGELQPSSFAKEKIHASA